MNETNQDTILIDTKEDLDKCTVNLMTIKRECS